ncbi:MAG: exodeoxyribonuclease V subunit gamma [Propionibacteriaceae bacterium]|nr:exodeoxyribonuclease V subunit gamma [Propionibacteriaceae bacterium]
MIRYTALDVEALADRLGQELSLPVADPFAEDLIVTRSGGLQRWLAQRLGLVLGSSGQKDGVCAGIQFQTLAQIRRRSSPADLEWSHQGLMPAILTALDALIDTEDFTQVRIHLADPLSRPRRRMSLVDATARRLADLVVWHTDMLAQWNDGDFRRPDGTPMDPSQRWQARLWNRVCLNHGVTVVEYLDHLGRHAGSLAGRYARVAVFCPQALTPVDERLLAGMDAQVPLHVYTCARTVSSHADLERILRGMTRPDAVTDEVLHRLHPVTRHLGDDTDRADARPESPMSVLRRVQWAASTGDVLPGPGDESIQIHTCPADRQVEVLAEVLTRVLNEDPSLQPRDILVLAHDMDRHLPALDAWFHPDDSGGATARHAMRVSLSSALPGSDMIADLVTFLIHLVQSRATAEDLLRLCSFPPVMAQYGFSEADVDALSTLIPASGIRWGVNAAQRAAEGMSGFAQNTWMAGLGRMVLGVALSEDDLVYRGTVLPLDAVESDTIALVGALGQIIATVRECCQTWTTPAEPTVWADRFTRALDALAGAGWTTTAPGRAIASLRRGQSPAMSLAEAETLVDQAWKDQAWQSSFLNGDLGVTPLGTMSKVPFRVVVLFGLDSTTFPRQRVLDGDDLSHDGPQRLDCRDEDRHILMDALTSARERLILICSDLDDASAPIDLPAPVADMTRLTSICVDDDLDVATSLIRHHPVVPPGAPATPAAAAFHAPTASPDASQEIEIDDLCDFLANPASHWLRRNVGVYPSLLKPTEPIPQTMPVTMSPLARWQVTDRMLRLLLRGDAPTAIMEAEVRRGLLPPGDMGVRLAEECLAQAQTIHHQAQPFLTTPMSWLAVDRTSRSDTALVGQVGVRGHHLVHLLAGRAAPRHQIAAWARILALTVAYPAQPWKAVLISARSSVTLTAPDPVDAERHLARLARVYSAGRVSPLPLPPTPAAHLARFLARGLPPNEQEIARRLADEWDRDPSWSLIWPTTAHMVDQRPQVVESELPDPSGSSFASLSHTVYVPMMKAGGVS